MAGPTEKDATSLLCPQDLPWAGSRHVRCVNERASPVCRDEADAPYMCIAPPRALRLADLRQDLSAWSRRSSLCWTINQRAFRHRRRAAKFVMLDARSTRVPTPPSPRSSLCWTINQREVFPHHRRGGERGDFSVIVSWGNLDDIHADKSRAAQSAQD